MRWRDRLYYVGRSAYSVGAHNTKTCSGQSLTQALFRQPDPEKRHVLRARPAGVVDIFHDRSGWSNSLVLWSSPAFTSSKGNVLNIEGF